VKRRELIWRSSSVLAAMVCFACLWIVSRQVWTGLATGRIRSKYGWMLREDRPVMFDITVGLTAMAALIWIGLGVLAIGFACSRRLYED
jgi:hypothetical protein